MLESIGNKFEYKKLSPEEQEKRGILGRLVGIIADYAHPTRNERWYPEKLWDKVFNDPIMKEKIKNRCVFGELGHPVDRTDIDMEKVAICLAEEPKKSKDGKLYGVFDILSTPCGKILKSLCDYGCTIGISSRGSGDTFINNSGKEEVDADTYECECWDAVLLPAVETARLQYVNESLDKNAKLRRALNEELNKASDEDKKVMREALESLNINLGSTEGDNDSSVNHISEDSDTVSQEAANDGADIAKEFLNTLKENKDLTKQVRDLQEQLSVCYTKEVKYQESITSLESQIQTLTESSAKLEEDEKSKKSLNEQIRVKDALINKLYNNTTKISDSKKSLQEEITRKDNQISSLNNQIKDLQESLTKEKNASSSQVKSLNETIAELKKDSSINRTSLQEKLQKANSRAERYKAIAKMAVDKYIGSRATMLGVDPEMISSKLNENYSFEDIDRVCESLKSYHFDMDALPFDTRRSGAKVRVKLTGSNEPIKKVVESETTSLDDECDDSLMNFAR